jgi:nucleotidyltransferase/DNA polymerase involved in DNA repair
MPADREILHIDMDAFFAAIEQRDHPEWRGKPLIVGSPPDRRGVVSTCSYEARRFGVRSAMPSREAGRLCPHGIFVPPDMARYSAVSHQVFAIFERFTPLIEPVSCDEAFLDVTGARNLFGDGVAIGQKIRAAIAAELRLTASVGVAGNKFLAKLCSELAKPDGLYTAPRERPAILAFLAPMPVGRLWGVGKVLRAELEKHGYSTVGDLQLAERTRLMAQVGGHVACHLKQLAFGEDLRDVEGVRDELSLSREHTFDTDCQDPDRLRSTLRDLADDVGRRLRAAGRYASVGRLKLRWSDFKTLTRQRPFQPPCCDDFTLREMALSLLEAEKVNRPVRLIGFGVSGLVNERREQPDLFEGLDGTVLRRQRQEALSATLDRLRDTLGDGSIHRGDARTVGRKR